MLCAGPQCKNEEEKRVIRSVDNENKKMVALFSLQSAFGVSLVSCVRE